MGDARRHVAEQETVHSLTAVRPYDEEVEFGGRIPSLHGARQSVPVLGFWGRRTQHAACRVFFPPLRECSPQSAKMVIQTTTAVWVSTCPVSLTVVGSEELPCPCYPDKFFSFVVMDVKLSLIGAMKDLPDAPGEVRIRSGDYQGLGLLLTSHNTGQGMLGFLLGFCIVDHV